jgi:hypothetical protein
MLHSSPSANFGKITNDDKLIRIFRLGMQPITMWGTFIVQVDEEDRKPSSISVNDNRLGMTLVGRRGSDGFESSHWVAVTAPETIQPHGYAPGMSAGRLCAHFHRAMRESESDPK